MKNFPLAVDVLHAGAACVLRMILPAVRDTVIIVS